MMTVFCDALRSGARTQQARSILWMVTQPGARHIIEAIVKVLQFVLLLGMIPVKGAAET